MSMTPKKPSETGKKVLSFGEELSTLAEKLNRYGYVLFAEKLTAQEKGWINNAFSEVAIRLEEISKALEAERATVIKVIEDGNALIKKLKLKDKTGISRQYQIAISNPTIMTVAALQDTWIRVVDFWMKSAEESPSKTDSEAIAKIEAKWKEIDRSRESVVTVRSDWKNQLDYIEGQLNGLSMANEILLSSVKSSEGQKS